LIIDTAGGGVSNSVPLLSVRENGGTDFVTVLGSGDVGIGTDGPSAKLQVKADLSTVYANVAPSIANTIISISNIQTSETTNDQAQIQFGVNGGTHNRVGSIGLIAEDATNRKAALVFTTDDASTRAEKMRITGDGKVGIGTTDPKQTLHVENSSVVQAQFNSLGGTSNIIVGTGSYNDAFSRIQFKTIKTGGSGEATSAIYQYGDIFSNNHLHIQSAQDIVFLSGSTETVRIKDGNVGIGTNNPSRLLTLENDSSTVVSNSQLRINNQGTGDSYIYMFAGSDWSLGIDNSDEDKFKIVPSNDVSDGGEVLCLSRTGEVAISGAYISNTSATSSETGSFALAYADQFKQSYTLEYSFEQSGIGTYNFNLAFTGSPIGFKYRALIIISRDGDGQSFGSIDDNSYIYREADNDFTHRSEDRVDVSKRINSNQRTILNGLITSFNADDITSDSFSGSSTYDYYIVRYPIYFGNNFTGTRTIKIHLETYGYNPNILSSAYPKFLIA
jgi:hypothetical protein